MSRIVTIAERFVEGPAGLIATPLAAAIGIIPLLHRIFDVVSAVGEPAGATVPSSGGVLMRVDCAALNQTPLVHSMVRLTRTDQHSYGTAALHGGRPR